MKWIFSILLMVCLSAQAETLPGSDELAVEMPAAAVSGSTTNAAESAMSPAEAGVAAMEAEQGLPVTEASAPTSASSSASADSVGIKNLKETEIPVHLETTKKAEAQQSPFFRILLSMAIVAVLGCGAFYFIRKHRFSNDPKAQATQIKVLTQHYLGPKKSLAIVRVAGESVLIGITDHNISMIKSLSLLDEEIPEETPKEFQSIFAKKTKNENANEETEAPENRDDFSISGIKDFVSVKLKNMRSFE